MSRFVWEKGDAVLRPPALTPPLPVLKGNVNLWLWRCDAGHLHARAECGGVVRESRADASFLPGNLKDYVPCRVASGIDADAAAAALKDEG